MIVTSVLQELVLIAGVGVLAAVALVWRLASIACGETSATQSGHCWRG